MIVAVCVDDKNGMLFNKRRQSRDRAQQENLLSLCNQGRLWIAPYSAALFEGDAQVMADEAFLEKAGAGEICFVENRLLAALSDQIEGVILYRWNRTYPADFRLDLDLSTFILKDTVEFPGTSHETITREIYERKER